MNTPRIIGRCRQCDRFLEMSLAEIVVSLLLRNVAEVLEYVNQSRGVASLSSRLFGTTEVSDCRTVRAASAEILRRCGCDRHERRARIITIGSSPCRRDEI